MSQMLGQGVPTRVTRLDFSKLRGVTVSDMKFRNSLTGFVLF